MPRAREKRYFLLYVLRWRLEYPDLRRQLMAQHETFSADEILIEEAHGVRAHAN